MTDKHRRREDEKKKQMAHPDWHKYSGFPPADLVPDDKPKKKGKQADPVIEPEADANGDGN